MTIDIVTIPVEGFPEGCVLVPVKLTKELRIVIERALSTNEKPEDLWRDVIRTCATSPAALPKLKLE